MSTPVIAFLGWDDRRTFLVYHLAWMYAELGYKVAAMDLNPQARLTTSFLPEEKLGKMWLSDEAFATDTICDWLGTAFFRQESREVHQEVVGHEAGLVDRLRLIASNPLLVDLERDLPEIWEEDASGDSRQVDLVPRVSELFRSLTGGLGADLVLVDLGYYPGTIARVVWTAASCRIFSVSPDPLSLRGLGVLGDAVQTWPGMEEAETVRSEGYVVLNRPVRVDRPSSFLEEGLRAIPEVYRYGILKQHEDLNITIREDPHCLGVLRETSGLLDMAREARKPVFLLKPADGAIGSLALAVQDAYRDFERLALRIAGRVGLPPVP